MKEYEIYCPDALCRQVEAAIEAVGLTISREYHDYGHVVFFYVVCTPDKIQAIELPPGSYLVGVSTSPPPA